MRTSVQRTRLERCDPKRMAVGRFGVLSPAWQLGDLRPAFHRFDVSDLLCVDDPEMTLFVIKHHRLPVRTDHEVIGVRDDERLAIAEHDADGPEGFGLHQFSKLIGDHQAQCMGRGTEGQMVCFGPSRRATGALP